jgi:two-component system OmpR family sensor kinase
VLEVADAGPGLSGEDAARAFDRFHRGADHPGSGAGHPGRPGNGPARQPDQPGPAGPADQTEELGRGSGLGLSIVQAIAVAHGGQAQLESQPGRGTRVRIWLPTGTPPAS